MLELTHAVHDDPADIGFDEVAHVGGDPVERQLDRFEVAYDELALAARAFEVPPERARLRDELCLRFLHGNVKTPFPAREAFGDEVHSDDRLTATRWSRDERNACRGDPAADHLIQTGDTRG